MYISICTYIYIYIHKYTRILICYICTTIYTQSFLESKGMNITHNIQHRNRKSLRNSRDFHYSRIAYIQTGKHHKKSIGFEILLQRILKVAVQQLDASVCICLHLFFLNGFAHSLHLFRHQRNMLWQAPLRSPRNCKLLQGRPSWRRHKLKPSK